MSLISTLVPTSLGTIPGAWRDDYMYLRYVQCTDLIPPNVGNYTTLDSPCDELFIASIVGTEQLIRSSRHVTSVRQCHWCHASDL